MFENKRTGTLDRNTIDLAITRQHVGGAFASPLPIGAAQGAKDWPGGLGEGRLGLDILKIIAD